MLGIRSSGRLLPTAALLAALTGIATVGIGAATAVPAFAVGCNANGCTGQDPAAQGCSAQTWETAAAPGGGSSVELRVSTGPGQCEAAWARSAGGFNILIQGSTTSNGSNIVVQYGQVDGDPGAGTEWTDMVSFTLWTRACIEGIDSTDWNCTGWH
jgi:hypothetical protein